MATPLEISASRRGNVAFHPDQLARTRIVFAQCYVTDGQVAHFDTASGERNTFTPLTHAPRPEPARH